MFPIERMYFSVRLLLVAGIQQLYCSCTRMAAMVAISTMVEETSAGVDMVK
jgi:hypothetical protein